MAKGAREFDIVIHGASGFTGRLVAEYMQAAHAGEVKWALSGRNLEKMAAVRAEMGLPETIPLVTADASDPASITALARRTKVVLTTVGPYQLYGSDLVAACAAAGTDYVDLCGEPAWMRLMIDAHDAEAKRTGARIVFSCGFDSIPSDLGIFLLQEEARKRFGAPCPRVHGRVRKMKGTFSGGTAASLKATLAAGAKDPRILEWMRDPFSLAPGFQGPKQPSGMKPIHDDKRGVWLAPFLMAAINTKNVHRSNALMGHAYGADFVYDEMLVTGPGEKGQAIAMAVAADKSMMSDEAPKPGEGPSKAEREAGMFDILFIGEMPDGRELQVVVTGDKDPGYGATSKMIAESAMALVKDRPDGLGGVTTTAPALGMALIERLRARAGMTFQVA